MNPIKLQEGGIQAILDRWNAVDIEILKIEIVAHVLMQAMPIGQKEPTRKNMLAYLEQELRRQNG